LVGVAVAVGGAGVLVGVAVVVAVLVAVAVGVGVFSAAQRWPVNAAVAVMPLRLQVSLPVADSVLNTFRKRPGLKSTGWPRSAG
jgi:hypothetical protein